MLNTKIREDIGFQIVNLQQVSALMSEADKEVLNYVFRIRLRSDQTQNVAV